MTDSTCLAVAPANSWPARWKEEKRRRYAVRRDVLQDIEARALRAASELIERQAAAPFGRRDVAAHITCQTAFALGQVWKDRRTMPRRIAVFRVLGDQARWAGLSAATAVSMIGTGVQEALGVVRRRVGDTSRDDTRGAVLRNLQAEAEAFAEDAAKELRLGMQGDLPPGRSSASVLLRLLDGRLSGDALGAAASAVGLDASREHGLVLIVHTQGDMRALEAAAQEIESTVHGAVDLGLGDTLPLARRLAFPVLTHGRWIEARTHLHDVATKHGVLAIAPIAAPTLGRLSDTYQAAERDLARVVQGCGYASGIIDPACIGPACRGKGVSPAPHDAALTDGLVPVLA